MFYKWLLWHYFPEHVNKCIPHKKVENPYLLKLVSNKLNLSKSKIKKLKLSTLKDCRVGNPHDYVFPSFKNPKWWGGEELCAKKFRFFHRYWFLGIIIVNRKKVSVTKFLYFFRVESNWRLRIVVIKLASWKLAKNER